MIPNVGPLEIGVLLLIALIVFGPKRLPELGNSLGTSIREFRSTITHAKGDDARAELSRGNPDRAADERTTEPAGSSARS